MQSIPIHVKSRLEIGGLAWISNQEWHDNSPKTVNFFSLNFCTTSLLCPGNTKEINVLEGLKSCTSVSSGWLTFKMMSVGVLECGGLIAACISMSIRR